MGIFLSDIFHKEEWNFAFGVASLYHHVGALSLARFEENFFNEDYEPNLENPTLFYRACRVMTHEICH